MEISKEKEEFVLLYSTYNILYINDLACNLVKELEPFIPNDDKEAKKIYYALLKRARKYFGMVDKIIGDKVYYLADYFGEMDDISDSLVQNFQHEIECEYENAKIDNCSLYAKVETMRSMCDFAKYTSEIIISRIKRITKKADVLNFYNIEEVVRIANNLANWMYRKIPKGIEVKFNKDSRTIKSLEKLNEALLDFENFKTSYYKALEYEKLRNDDNVCNQ